MKKGENAMHHVYIAACAPNGGIYHYTIEENGRLTEKEYTPCPSPMYLVKEGKRLFVPLRGGTSENNESYLVTFAINEDGSLCPEDGMLSTKGCCACHLTVENGTAWAVNYASGSVVRLPEGTLVTHTGKGPHPTRQKGPHTHYVCLSPDGGHLLVTDLGIDAILLYTKELCELGRLTLPAGAGPRHLAFSPDGKLLYCANELGCSVSIFAYDGASSKLLETIPTLPADFTGQNTTAAIRVVGDELFVSDRGFDTITVFKREGSTLTPSYRIPCGGSSPRDFDITPDGRFLICTNEFSDLVTVFEKKNGKFERLPQTLTLPRPLCVIYD
jgi:6-phosphogluconolactonase